MPAAWCGSRAWCASGESERKVSPRPRPARACLMALCVTSDPVAEVTRLGLRSKAHLPDDSQRLTTKHMAVQGGDVSNASRRELVRGLGTIDTLSLVVGTIIGTGIFLKAAVMA